jgi:hypothetical protein
MVLLGAVFGNLDYDFGDATFGQSLYKLVTYGTARTK